MRGTTTAPMMLIVVAQMATWAGADTLFGLGYSGNNFMRIRNVSSARSW